MFLNCPDFWFAIYVTTQFLNWELPCFLLFVVLCFSVVPVFLEPSCFQCWLFRDTDWLCPDQHVTSSLELPSPAAASILCKLELNYYGLLWIIQWLPCFSCCCIMSLLMICTTEGRGCFLKLLSELFEDNNLFPTKPILLVQAYAKQNMCLQRNKSKSSCLLQNGVWEGLFEPRLLFAPASPCQSPEHRAWGFILSQLSQWELLKILSIGFVVFWSFWLFCY